MFFRQLFDESSYTYTYVLAAGAGREAVIIDPVKEKVPALVALFQEWDLRCQYILDTHTHADHISGSGLLKKAWSCQIAMSDKTKVSCVDLFLKDGDVLALDGLSLRAIHTPGHTQDSISYYWKDYNKVFTGDTLLIRGTGRTDFQEGDPFLQYDSLFHKLLVLPDETLVYPGHDYAGLMVSTIGEEKRFNPRLQVKNKEAYAEIMNHLNLPKPRLMDIAVPANLRCGL